MLKQQKIGNWITLGTLVLLIISAIIYGVNVGGAGWFNGAAISSVVAITVVTVLLLAGLLVLAQLKIEGTAGKAVDIVCDALRIVIPALLVLALVNLIDGRVEGLAYIYFSNPDVLATIQTPANLAAGQTAIASFVFYGITAVAAIVAAFFGIGKKEN